MMYKEWIMGFWDIFSPQIPPTTGGSWRSRSFLDALLDDKKEQSRSSRTSQSSYIYDYDDDDDDDDDYDWEKEERKRVRSSLQRKYKKFLQEKSAEVIEVLSNAKLCSKKVYEPNLKLKSLRYEYFDLSSDYWKANIAIPYRIAKLQVSDILSQSVSKDAHEAFVDIVLWFNKTYDGNLMLSNNFRADLSMLIQIHNARNEIKEALRENV